LVVSCQPTRSLTLILPSSHVALVRLRFRADVMVACSQYCCVSGYLNKATAEMVQSNKFLDCETQTEEDLSAGMIQSSCKLQI
jgi:hypothetical protein